MNDNNRTDRLGIVTGANRGIGKEIVRGLAEKGMQVALVGRDRESLEQAKSEIAKDTGNDRLDIFVADLASQKQIRSLADELLEAYDHIDVLINNAGVITQNREETEDGIEKQWAVNHLAPFLLTNLLLERIRASAPARIITVSSNAHHGAKINFDDPGLSEGYHRLKAYGQSKLANILFTRELAKRLEDTEVTANALHPGVIGTNLLRNYMGEFKPLRWVGEKVGKDTEKGADTPVWLATSDEVADVSGEYFAKRRKTKASKAAQDDDAARRLWALSAEMTGLKS